MNSKNRDLVWGLVILLIALSPWLKHLFCYFAPISDSDSFTILNRGQCYEFVLAPVNAFKALISAISAYK